MRVRKSNEKILKKIKSGQIKAKEHIDKIREYEKQKSELKPYIKIFLNGNNVVYTELTINEIKKLMENKYIDIECFEDLTDYYNIARIYYKTLIKSENIYYITEVI